MSIFVSIDGVDGVGKTTTARLLAASRGFQYYKSPSGPFEDLRKEVDKYASPIGRYAFYRLALEHDSAVIAKMLETGPVVADRYIASTFAYHVVLDPRTREIHSEMNLLRPTFQILLSARPEIRIRRLEKRRAGEMRKASDVKLEDNVALLNNVADIFRSLGLSEIDTSDITPEEVVTRISAITSTGG